MNSQGPRFDILVLNSGATAKSIRARFAALDMATDPVVLVRRQGVGAVTWYRVGRKQLAAAVDRADDAATLSTILTLDAANKVPATQMGTVRGIGLGAMLVGDEPIAGLEGVPEPSAAEPIRAQLRANGITDPPADVARCRAFPAAFYLVSVAHG